MIDIFQFNNMYGATEKITQIAFNQDLQRSCLKYVVERSKSTQIASPSRVTEEDKETDFDICIQDSQAGTAKKATTPRGYLT